MEIKGIRLQPYGRVSSPAQKKRNADAEIDEPSLGEQFDEIEKDGKNRGWQILPRIEDVIPGAVPVKDRPGGAILYQMAERDEFDVLGIYDNDRIGRDEDAVVAKVFRSNMRFFGKQILSVHQPVEIKNPELYKPYEDDSSLWLEAVSDTASSVYIRQFRRRHAFGMRKRVELKKLMAGSCPIGYIAERVILPNGKTMLGERKLDMVYVPIIRRIFNEYESGCSFRDIAGSLNKDGLKTTKGYVWTATTVEGIVNNPTYYGATVYYKDRSIGKPDPKHPGRRKRQRQPIEKWLIVDDGQHPAIIEKAQWLRCQEIKKAKASYGRTYGESTLLSGLIECGKCGGSMCKHSGWQGGYFSCSRYWKTGKTQCSPNSIKRLDLEKYVIEYVGNLAKNPDILAKLKVVKNSNVLSQIENELESLGSKRSAVKQAMRKTREAFEAGIDKLADFGQRKSELEFQDSLLQEKEIKLTEAAEKIKKAKEVQKSLTELLDNFSEKFSKKTLRIQKMLLREIVEKIVITDKKAKIIFKDDMFYSSDYERAIDIAAVAYYHIEDPKKSVLAIQKVDEAVNQISQTTVRNVVGQFVLDQLLSETANINTKIKNVIDSHTEPWGVQVTAVEIKDITLPDNMQRAMAKEAEAERERRAKIVAAEGEFQAATKLGEAADVITKHPVALQLRTLQTMAEISTEKSSTIIFPAQFMTSVQEALKFFKTGSEKK